MSEKRPSRSGKGVVPANPRMPGSFVVADTGAGTPLLPDNAGTSSPLAVSIPASSKVDTPAKHPRPSRKTTDSEGHRARLRKRFLNCPSALPDYELLELLLGHVIIRKDTKPIAKALLKHFATFRRVMDAQAEDLADVPGVGPGVVAYWQLLQEMMARYAESPVYEKRRLGTPEEIATMARQRLGALKHEEVWCVFVNSGNRLIAWQRMATGSVDEAPLYPREILAHALRLKATGFVLVHNHPGNASQPSGADIALTRQILKAANAIGLQFLDHLIVTENACCSMAREGLLVLLD